MKLLALITTSLLALPSLFGGVSASAAGGATNYPQYTEFVKSLEFSSLTDFAVNGDEYAFIEHGETFDSVKLHKGDSLTTHEFGEGEILTALDCADGKFYYSLKNEESGDKVYSLPDKAESDHTMPEAEAKTTIVLGDYIYKLSNTQLTVAYIDETDHSKDFLKTLDGEYKNLKRFGDAVYAVKSNGLYSFDGSEEKLLEFKYIDYSSTLEIAVGSTQTDLTANYSLKFVTIGAGSYMTEVDLTNLGGEHFEAKQTQLIAEDTLALLLCYTGNAAVVAIGEKSYVTLKTSVTETEQTCTTEPEFGHATVTGNRIYASPFVIVGTSVLFPATGAIVEIKNKIEHEVLGSAFYEVEYADADGNKHIGYVTEGFLTEYIIEDNKPPYEYPDPNHSEKTDTRTVILILLVVILVLAAISYIAYVLTSDKRKKKNALPSDDESASAK
mgnify:FL=1